MSRVNFGAKPLMYPQPVLITKLKPISFDPFGNGYYGVGQKVGNAFKDGAKLK